MSSIKLNGTQPRFNLGELSGIIKYSSSYQIAPGSGPIGSMPSVEQIGQAEDFGYTSYPIARWNMIPLEDISTGPTIGVIAFGINEIDRVELSVDNGEWFKVTEMTNNARTGCWEYHAPISDAGYTAGTQIELRGRVYPKSAGQSFNLPIMTVNYGDILPKTFYCSPHGSDTTGDGTEGNPYLTVGRVLTRLGTDAGTTEYAADGITIILKGNNDGITPAEYTITHPASNNPLVENSWFTVQGDLNVDRQLIRIVGSGNGGVRARNIRYKHLTFWQQGVCAVQLKAAQGSPLSPNVWCDDTYHTDSINYDLDPSTAQNVITASAFSYIAFTDCECYKVQDGFKLYDLARNCSANEMVEDCYGGGKLCVNVTATNQQYVEPLHPDLFELYPYDEPVVFFNCIGLKSAGQGIFAGQGQTVSDFAYVNVIAETSGGAGDLFGAPPTSQIRNSDLTSGQSYAMSNILLDCVSLPARNFVLSNDNTLVHTIKDVMIRNSVFWNITGGTDVLADVVVQNCKSVNSGAAAFTNPLSTGNTSGSAYTLPGGTISTNTATAMWTYTDIEDFRPATSSVLGFNSRTVPIDATLTLRRDTTSIGALESST